MVVKSRTICPLINVQSIMTPHFGQSHILVGIVIALAERWGWPMCGVMIVGGSNFGLFGMVPINLA